jgi:hypothetical protein
MPIQIHVKLVKFMFMFLLMELSLFSDIPEFHCPEVGVEIGFASLFALFQTLLLFFCLFCVFNIVDASAHVYLG